MTVLRQSQTRRRVKAALLTRHPTAQPADRTYEGLAFLMTLLQLACAPAEPERFSVEISATNDELTPVAGVEVVLGDASILATDATGRTTAEVVGGEGDQVAVHAVCPEGHGSAQVEDSFRLRRMSSLNDARKRVPLAIPIRCPRNRLDVALVVSSGVAAIPVRVDGQTRGLTDERGFAHVGLSVPSGARVQVELDTRGRPQLRPINPERTFLVTTQSTLLVHSQQLTKKRLKRARRKPARKPPSHQPRAPKLRRPYRIGSGDTTTEAASSGPVRLLQANPF